MARSNRYIADLYRRLQKINASLPADQRIDFFTADTHFQFYKKPLIKDYLAFLRLIINPDDETSFLRLAGKCVDGVTGEMIAAINDYSSLGLSVGQFLSEQVYLSGDYYKPLTDAYAKGNVVVYDLETTGLDLDDDRAIQISAVKTGKNGTIKTFNRFIIPPVPIKKAAEAVHGYNEEYIRSHGGAPAAEVLANFCEFAKGCVLAGHNSASFDDIILERELKTENIPHDFGYRYDTLKIAALLKPGTGDYKLATLCDAFGIVNERAHDAFSDVTATEKVLGVFIKNYIRPTSAARTNVTERFSAVFRDFYELTRSLRQMLIDNDLLTLVKTCAGKLGVTKEKNDLTDKESTNDFYRTLKSYIDKSEPISSLKAFLQDVSLSGSQMDVLVKKFNKVPLVTVHQSKGCEFKKVIVAGTGEGEFPSFGAVASGNEEEEKRVFYVALTRAKEKLTITYPRYKTFYDVNYRRAPSPYLDFLPDKYVTKITQ